jgi:hypothetical protein
MCRGGFNKRSLTKLYLSIQEPEVNAELAEELKKHKQIAEKFKEKNEERDKEFENLRQSCVQIM